MGDGDLRVKVLVTGAAGFIGTHLRWALQDRGHVVGSMDKRRGCSTAGLGLVRAKLTGFEPDLIVHCGASCSTAVSLRDPVTDFTDNVVGTFNVCEAARADSIPVIFMSSVKVEPGADGKVAPLGLSKQIGESYLQLYRTLYELPYVINRPSTVYGPGQDGTSDSGWVTWFLRAAGQGAEITLNGDGTQSRDVLFIDDFVRLLVDQVEHFDLYEGSTYPVGGGPDNEVSLNELLGHLGYANVVHQPRLAGDLQRVVTDNTHVSAVNGWRPRVHWRDGIERTRRSL